MGGQYSGKERPSVESEIVAYVWKVFALSVDLVLMLYDGVFECVPVQESYPAWAGVSSVKLHRCCRKQGLHMII